MGITLKRLESLSLRELSILLTSDSKLEKLRMVNVTEVRITNDLSFMTIFYTIFDENKKGSTMELLETNKAYIRSKLAAKIKARKMPNLIFKYDEALAYGNHIAKLLQEEKEKINPLNDYEDEM